MNKGKEFLKSLTLPSALAIAAMAVTVLMERAVVAEDHPALHAGGNALAQYPAPTTPTGFVSEYEDAEESPQANSAMQRAEAVSRLLPDVMPEIHLMHRNFDETMSPFAWTNYLDSLDFERAYFTQEDINEFKQYENTFHVLMRSGDLSFAQLAFDRLRQRVNERMEFVRANVTNDFDFTASGTYTWKRKDVPWPADSAEQDALWTKRIANSILAYRVNSQIASENNSERLADIRLDIAREMKAFNTNEVSTSSPAVPEAELANELGLLEAALSGLDHLPTNAAERAEFQLMLERAPGDQAQSSTNETSSVIGQTQTTTNKISSLIEQYFFVAGGIITPEEAAANAAKETLDNHISFENILKDSDEEFYLSRYFNAMTTAYDPHSNYLSPVSMEDFGIDMQLSLQGIGAQLQTEDGAAKVAEIIPGSPAERDTSENRLVPGDKIIGVAQGDEEFVDIRHWPLYKAVRLIRGPKGSTVRLQVIPANAPTGLKIVTLVRDEIKLEEQAASSRLEIVTDENGTERKLGYIKLPTFYSSMNLGNSSDATPRSATIDVARLIAEFNSKNVEGIILDLRSNGGGSLPEAVYLTGLFIRTGPVVQVKESRRTIPLPDNDPAIAFSKPLVVMVNRLSASASEIVAGALQDYGRAVIVGDTRTHGKGTVQTLVPLAEGKLGSLKSTTASFYRVNGSSTQIRGVESDIVLPSVFDYFSDLGEDKLNNPIPWTRTGPSRYRAVDSLYPIIGTLRERSEKRRAGNEKWCNHIEVLERYGAFSTNTVVSLNYEVRLEKAREDAALSRKIADDTAMGEGTGLDALGDGAPDAVPDRKAPSTKEEREMEARKRDIVLDESLNILMDLIILHGSPRNLNKNASPYDFLDTFFR